jgi:MtN3 and saliva related transmembrane protein
MLSDVVLNPEVLANFFGTVAAFCTTIAFVPQVLHTLRTRDVSGISLGMYSIFTFGVLMWFIYGVMLGSWPMIIANIITFILAATVLVLKLRLR